METFNLKILSPYKELNLPEVTQCSIESNNDFYVILPEHTNLCSSTNIGKLYIQRKNEEMIYNFFSVSLNFDSLSNTLNIFCLDFDHSLDLISNISEIRNKLSTDSLSYFHLQLTQENNLILEKFD